MKFFIILSFFVILAVVGNETNCDPCTNVTEIISNYWKTNMSERFGFCGEISEIQDIYNNMYRLATLEIEENNNKTVQSCVYTLKIGEKCNVITLTYFYCSGIKHGGQEIDEPTEWDNVITENYNRFCLVEDIGIQTENNIWAKVFGEDEEMTQSVNGRWTMVMRLTEPAENLRNRSCLSHKLDKNIYKTDTGVFLKSIHLATYFDPLYLDKEIYSIRKFSIL